MAMSRPMQVMAVRLSDEERSRLEEVARKREITVSAAVREGLQLLIADEAARRGVRREGRRALAV